MSNTELFSNFKPEKWRWQHVPKKITRNRETVSTTIGSKYQKFCYYNNNNHKQRAPLRTHKKQYKQIGLLIQYFDNWNEMKYLHTAEALKENNASNI